MIINMSATLWGFSRNSTRLFGDCKQACPFFFFSDLLSFYPFIQNVFPLDVEGVEVLAGVAASKSLGSQDDLFVYSITATIAHTKPPFPLVG